MEIMNQHVHRLLLAQVLNQCMRQLHLVQVSNQCMRQLHSVQVLNWQPASFGASLELAGNIHISDPK